MKNLLILSDPGFSLTPARLQYLSEQGLSVDYRGSAAVAPLAGTSILWGAPEPALLKHAVFLEWHHLSAPPVGRYADLSLYANPNIVLTKPQGVFGVPTAERILSLLLSLLRGDDRLCLFEEPRELTGASVALLGLGDVGRALARLLSGFSARILGVRRHFLSPLPEADEMFDLYDLSRALSRADVAVSCLPRTSETAGLWNEAAFSAMKPGAVFVALGGGPDIDGTALAHALTAGHLAGAGFLSGEAPWPPAGHPLWTLPQFRVVPERSWVSGQVEKRRFDQFCGQLELFLSGRRLQGAVDFFYHY